MPYIEQWRRKQLEYLIDQMSATGVSANGDLNYLLFAFCKRDVDPSYNNYKNFCGELRQCATEIERGLLGPYEDKKIQENGDVE